MPPIAPPSRHADGPWSLTLMFIPASLRGIQRTRASLVKVASSRPCPKFVRDGQGACAKSSASARWVPPFRWRPTTVAGGGRTASSPACLTSSKFDGPTSARRAPGAFLHLGAEPAASWQRALTVAPAHDGRPMPQRYRGVVAGSVTAAPAAPHPRGVPWHRAAPGHPGKGANVKCPDNVAAARKLSCYPLRESGLAYNLFVQAISGGGHS
jgi:hypothetical protein